MAEKKSEELKSVFDVLKAVDVSKHVEIKDTGKTKLSYLSWAWAWAEVKQRYPDTTYEVIKFNGLPYAYDEKTGYMVYTTVTIEGLTHEMWLPVMDGNNRSMLDHPYKVTFKNGNSITVQPATMFDINKTIMRCLTKNLAMHGLGHSIYAGEDLPVQPEEETRTEQENKPAKKGTAEKQEAEKQEQEDPDYAEKKKAYLELITFCNKNKLNAKEICSSCGLTKDSTKGDFENALEYVQTLLMMGGEG